MTHPEPADHGPAAPGPWRRPLLSARGVRAYEHWLMSVHGVDETELMGRAGGAVADALLRDWPALRRGDQAVGILAGPGNNGGDGWCAAAQLLQRGVPVRLWQLGSPGQGVATQFWRARALAAGLRTEAEAWEWCEEGPLPALAVWVDALLGLGASRPPGKPGLYTGAGPEQAGSVEVADLGLGEALSAWLVSGPVEADGVRGARCLGELLDGPLPRLPRRTRIAHKKSLLPVHVIAGSVTPQASMLGAARLAAEAALACGAGWVRLELPTDAWGGLGGVEPALLLGSGACGDWGSRGVLLAGPGLGQDETALRRLRRALGHAHRCDWPAVLDADALNLLAGEALPLPAHCVLTPHPGEAARLLGCSTAEIEADRPAAARALAQRFGAVVVLKGAGTLLAAPGDTPLRLCPRGHPGMAVAGMGDVLAGVIAGLLAQGLTPAEAAATAVCWHAEAGAMAARAAGYGLLPGQLLPWLRRWTRAVAA